MTLWAEKLIQHGVSRFVPRVKFFNERYVGFSESEKCVGMVLISIQRAH